MEPIDLSSINKITLAQFMTFKQDITIKNKIYPGGQSLL